MRTGLVVDATCDLPQEFLAAHGIRVLPIRIHLGRDALVDRRVPEATRQFYAEQLASVAPRTTAMRCRWRRCSSGSSKSW